MTLEDKNTVLQAKNLSVGYFGKKGTEVVSEDINFSISEGELVGLVGSNGIGKSTLLRTLAGMQNSIEGTIEINSKKLSDFTTLQLATQLSVVLTEPPASKNLTVEELVSLGRQPYTNWMGKLSEKDKEIIQFAIHSCEIESFRKRKCFELSDGQLQRVAIARALAQDTPLIILDEPTTHLDLYHRAYVLKLLKKLAVETTKTILFSTHEIDLAIQLADKMIVMTAGNIHYNTPCNLITAGTFNALFPEETIGFDANTGRFTIKK